MVRKFDKNTREIIQKTIFNILPREVHIYCTIVKMRLAKNDLFNVHMPSTKIKKFFLDEILKMFKIKLKKNLKMATINKKFKYHTIANIIKKHTEFGAN